MGSAPVHSGFPSEGERFGAVEWYAGDVAVSVYIWEGRLSRRMGSSSDRQTSIYFAAIVIKHWIAGMQVVSKPSDWKAIFPFWWKMNSLIVNGREGTGS